MKNFVLAGVLSTLSVLGTVGIMSPNRAANTGLPVGTIIAWGGETGTLPPGWALCNGRPLSKTVYAELFAAIGTSWGSSGDLFNLPDLRGRFLRGEDGGTGRDPEAKSRRTSRPGGKAAGVGSVQDDSVQDHTHAQRPHQHQYQYHTAFTMNMGSDYFVPHFSDVVNTDTTPAKVDLLGTDHYKTKSPLKSGEESRPKNAAVNFIIKVK